MRRLIDEEEIYRAIMQYIRARDNQKVFSSKELEEELKQERRTKLDKHWDWRRMQKSFYYFMVVCKLVFDLYRPVFTGLVASDYKCQEQFCYTS